MSLENRVKPHIAELEPYKPGKRADHFGLPDCARISVGRPEDNERCVKALRHLREAGVSRLR